jgi:GntR family transcriptional regulator
MRNTDADWDDGTPIYRQLRDIVVTMILDKNLSEGDAVPSVRHVAAQFQVNPLTVLKSYQQLVGEGLIESRRGRGMFVLPGARQRLLASERERFLQEEWPRVVDTLHRLGLSADELLKGTRRESGAEATKPRSSDRKQ